MLHGDIQAAFLNVASTAGMVQAGQLRPVAVVNHTRLPEYLVALAAAIRFAAAAAGLKCTRLGGSMAAPRRGEVDALLARAPASKFELP